MQQLSDENIRRIEEVVHLALSRKYPATDSDLREKIIRPLIARLQQLPLEELSATVGDIKDVNDDARNQIVTLILVERDWATRPVANVDLATIHRSIYGN